MKLKKLLEDLELKTKTKLSLDSNDVEILKQELEKENHEDEQTADMDGVEISETLDKISGACVSDGNDAGEVKDSTDNVFTEDNLESHLDETGKLSVKKKARKK